MSIRETINDYLKCHRGDIKDPSQFTIRCFVGMLETGEANVTDFDAVRPGLSTEVLSHQQSISTERKANR